MGSRKALSSQRRDDKIQVDSTSVKSTLLLTKITRDALRDVGNDPVSPIHLLIFRVRVRPTADKPTADARIGAAINTIAAHRIFA